MPTTQWEKLSAQLVPLLAGLASTHPVLNLLSLASLQPVKLFKQTNHLPSLSTTTTMEKKGHSTLKAYLRKPLCSQVQPQGGLPVTQCPLPQTKYM